MDYEINKNSIDNENNIDYKNIENSKEKKVKENIFGFEILDDDDINMELNDVKLHKANNTNQLSNKNNKNANNFKRKSTAYTHQSLFNNTLIDKPEIEDIFLEQITNQQNEKIKNQDSFCESFFLSSFSKDKGKLMDRSEDDQAECKHFICSILPAMQPEIIYKYPKEDIKGLEINNLAASICYPNGIKLCYEEDQTCIKTVNNYRSSFTNQEGERFFAVIYHFYLKMKNEDFESSYQETPIKYKLNTYQNELYSIFNDELEEDILKKLNIYEEMNLKEYVYIPFCLCLISRYPFFEQMEKCLESIMISINNNEQSIEELNKLITYIVKSIPAPQKYSKIYFPLPYFNKFVEIQQPYFRDITQFGNNPLIILNYLSASHILCLFKLLIFEQKVLVIGKNNDIISQILLNFVSLLYPFEWIHTFIPIMSEKMLKFLQAFLPFFNGLNISLFQKAKPILEKATKGVFIFNIDEDKVDINSNIRINSKHTKTTSYIRKIFPNFPKNIENLMLKELKSIKNKS